MAWQAPTPYTGQVVQAGDAVNKGYYGADGTPLINIGGKFYNYAEAKNAAYNDPNAGNEDSFFNQFNQGWGYAGGNPSSGGFLGAMGAGDILSAAAMAGIADGAGSLLSGTPFAGESTGIFAPSGSASTLGNFSTGGFPPGSVNLAEGASDIPSAAAGTMGSGGNALTGPLQGTVNYVDAAGNPMNFGNGVPFDFSGSGSTLGNLAQLGGLASAAGGIFSGLAAKSAAQTQANAANNATQATLSMFNTQNAQQAPYRAAGYAVLPSLAAGLGVGPSAGGINEGQFVKPFTLSDLTANLDPSYEFIKGQGIGAATNAGNVAGGVGGNTLKGVVDYATNFAKTGAQTAYNIWSNNQTNIINRLLAAAGFGQTANAQGTQLAGATIPAVAQSTQNVGTALAGGTVGLANALTGGANNALGWYALPQLAGGY